MEYSTQKLQALRAAIGRNIHDARIHRKVLLNRLSGMTGVSSELLDRYELGKNEIRLEEILKIACALKVKAHSLLNDDIK
ncbi:MAG TPA: helix-turn-helix domain-containing protein [Candidatus Binataceae bacterium]|nr:helix-turn-helix domain-containing protein [Candidatus Binataceae bacterium]